MLIGGTVLEKPYIQEFLVQEGMRCFKVSTHAIEGYNYYLKKNTKTSPSTNQFTPFRVQTFGPWCPSALVLYITLTIKLIDHLDSTQNCYLALLT